MPQAASSELLITDESPKIELMPGQREFMHVPNHSDVTMDVAIYQGGVGSGKTFIGCFLGLMLLRKNPGLRLLCLAKTFPLLRDTTMQTYFELLEMMGFKENQHYVFRRSDNLLIFPCYGGSVIMFRHLQDPEKIKSINAGAVQIEEISQIGENDYRMALSRLRQANIKRYRMFGHTNPESAKGWIYKNFVENNSGPVETVWKGAKGEEQRALIQYRRVIASTMDNHHLPPHYVESLRQSYDEDYFKVYVLGQDADYRVGLVARHFNEANIDESINWHPSWPLYLTCDFNFDPMCWYIGHRVDGDFHLLDEIIMEGATIEDAAMEYCSRFGEHKGPLFVGGDASGKSRRVEGKKRSGVTSYGQMMTVFDREGISRATLDVPAGNPRIIDRINIFNGVVSNAEGRRRLKVHPRCKRSLYNMNTLKFITGSRVIDSPTPTDISRDPDKKFLGHPFDAVSYWICRYTPMVVDKGGWHGQSGKRIKTIRT